MYKLFLILSLVYAFEETNVQWTFLSCRALVSQSVYSYFKVTRPSFLGGYHPTLKLSGIPTFTFIVSLTHRMNNI